MSVSEAGFWDPRFEPARKNRFRISYIPLAPDATQTQATNYWWWAISAQLPAFEINDESYQLVNRKFRYPGLLTWNDVQITLYEKGDMATFIMSMLQNAGYSCGNTTEKCKDTGILKGGFYNSAELIIEELKPDGSTLQKFSLKNWFLKGANFGELSMEDEGFLTVQMTIGYDCAVVEAATTN